MSSATARNAVQTRLGQINSIRAIEADRRTLAEESEKIRRDAMNHEIYDLLKSIQYIDPSGRIGFASEEVRREFYERKVEALWHQAPRRTANPARIGFSFDRIKVSASFDAKMIAERKRRDEFKAQEKAFGVEAERKISRLLDEAVHAAKPIIDARFKAAIKARA